MSSKDDVEVYLAGPSCQVVPNLILEPALIVLLLSKIPSYMSCLLELAEGRISQPACGNMTQRYSEIWGCTLKKRLAHQCCAYSQSKVDMEPLVASMSPPSVRKIRWSYLVQSSLHVYPSARARRASNVSDVS